MYKDVLDRLAKSLSVSELYESREFGEAVRIAAQARVNSFAHAVPEARGVGEMLEGELIRKAWQVVDQLAGKDSPSAWLSEVLRREVAEVYDADKYGAVGASYKTGRRRAKRDDPIEFESLDDLPGRPEGTNLLEVIQVLCCDTILDFRIVSLRVSGHSQEETAEELKLDQGTVSRHLRRIESAFWRWAARANYRIPGKARRKPSLIQPRRRGVA